jgi:AcrR family transcriptional regulator
MAAAGMARGTFYNYFPDREALLKAVLVDIQSQLREQVDDQIPDHLPPEATLACMVYGFLRLSLCCPDTGRALAYLCTGSEWLTQHPAEEQVFPHADSALEILFGDTPFSLGLLYLEGSINLLLRRLQEGQIDMAEASQVITLVLRGLGVSPARIRKAIATAESFSAQLAERAHTAKSPAGN